MSDLTFDACTAFTVTIRTNLSATTYPAIAASSADAWCDAADAQGDTPCGITVTPAGAQ